jgi:16S rRNA (uracil1498-N3)-methyltransferase
VQPVVAARSTGRIAGERAAHKRAHWQRVAIAACEQCGRNRVPEILEPVALEQYCRAAAAPGVRLLLAPEAQLGLREAAARLAGAATLAAGPEAGFTAGEEALLAETGFVPVRLGPRVLRTETAALAALAALNALAGDF